VAGRSGWCDRVADPEQSTFEHAGRAAATPVGREGGAQVLALLVHAPAGVALAGDLDQRRADAQERAGLAWQGEGSPPSSD
jgi:hypothetical protein